MPNQEGYAWLRSFPELDVAGVLPCSNLGGTQGSLVQRWMGAPPDNDQSNLWPFPDDSPPEFWNCFPNFISGKGTLKYVYVSVYMYPYICVRICMIYVSA